MELRPLLDVDLREALAPINRAARGEFLPALRTVAQLRERASCGVLDLKLSRGCWVGGALGASCLVDHLADEPVAHIEALASEPLAGQRGAVRALIEAVQTATAAAGVTDLSMLVSELDSSLGAVLQAVGFSRRQGVERYLLSGAPAALALPTEIDASTAPGASGSYARPTTLAAVQALLATAGAGLYGQRPSVLHKLSPRLSVWELITVSGPEATVTPQAAVVFDRERKSLCALGGETAQLAALIALVATRHGVAYLDALVDSDPAGAALRLAGFARMALRAELSCDPRQAVAERQRATAESGGGTGRKGSE